MTEKKEFKLKLQLGNIILKIKGTTKAIFWLHFSLIWPNSSKKHLKEGMAYHVSYLRIQSIILGQAWRQARLMTSEVRWAYSYLGDAESLNSSMIVLHGIPPL